MGTRLFSTALFGLAVGALLNWFLVPPTLSHPPSAGMDSFHFALDPWTPPIPTTTSPTTTLPEPIEGDRSCPTYEPLFREYGLKPVKTFSYIAWRESRCQPDAINARWNSQGQMVWSLNKNGSWDSGLLQINSTWRTVTRNVCDGGIEMLLELDCNLRVAKYLLDNGGLGHWKASLN